MRSRISVLSLGILFMWVTPAVLTGCSETPKSVSPAPRAGYASGFTINRINDDLTEIVVHTPWPDAPTPFRYAFLNREAAASTTLNREAYDGIVLTPVRSLIATSTTHIPALEALGELQALKGFPDTRYISSDKARDMIYRGLIADVGMNEAINTESVLELNPELIVGFSINDQNATYDVLQRAGIPIVYNGDWVENHPLGKAEWIRFFGVMFEKENIADSIFNHIVTEYENAKALGAQARTSPTVLSGAMFRDVWYLPAGESWAAQFFKDANARYLWSDTRGTGSLSLSFESVLAKGAEAEVWMGASQFTSYGELLADNQHYRMFRAFRDGRIYTISKTLGKEGGVLFYELAPNRPDLVLKDMIHILHPGLLPDHKPVFYKPLDALEK